MQSGVIPMADIEVNIEVTYQGGQPVLAEYYSVKYGLVRYTIEDGIAIVDDKWDKIDEDALADGFEQNLTTDHIDENVRQLPFVEEVIR